MSLPAWGGRYCQRLTALCLAVKGTTCHLCGGAGADTADHIVPRSISYDDSLSNLAPAHQGCNSARRAMPLSEWFATHPLPRREALGPSRNW